MDGKPVVKPKRTTLPFRDTVLDHFDQRCGQGSERHLDNVPRILVSVILARHDFTDLESLIAHCNTPENLRCCLPNEADRIIFSDRIVTILRELTLSRSTTCISD